MMFNAATFNVLRRHNGLALLIVAVVSVAGYSLLLWWFAATDFYNTRFFDRGPPVSLYNAFRAAFIIAISWLIYAPGAAALALITSRNILRNIPLPERYALGFVSGAGIWHLALFCLGLVGAYTKEVAIAISLAVMILSVPHLKFSVAEAGQRLARLFSPADSTISRNLLAAFLLLLCAALFVAIKGLYPAGGHDYYTHYFQYYQSVIRNASILPNEVWYHFYYSKGAGLYFLAILLTDPLAPQLVSTTFIAAGTLIVSMVLYGATSSRTLAVTGAILYVMFLIYTPGPQENMKHGGWGDLEKLHEPAAVMCLGILWICTRLEIAEAHLRRAWLLGLVLAVSAAVLLTTVMAVIVGAFLFTLFWLALARKSSFTAVAILLGGCTAVAVLGCVLLLNYALTGLPLDQAILEFWPIVNLERIDEWGVLNEVLVLHWALTGHLANKAPLTWEVLPLLAKYLRLDIWWPLAILGIVATAWSVRVHGFGQLVAQPAYRSTITCLIAFVAVFTVIAVGFGAGRQQSISFYRFSSFTYGPTLCLTLLLCFSFPARARTPSSLIAVVLLCSLALLAYSGALGQSWYRYAGAVTDGTRNVWQNARFFLQGRFSLKDAYQNQQGWPGRMPWGGLYPAMEQVWRHVGRGTPVYTMLVHSYCMLPNCATLAFMSTRVTRRMEMVLLGEPQEAMKALRASGIEFFFVSNELQIYSPLVRSPLFSPERIGKYLGVVWTDGTSYLLSWHGPGVGPIGDRFLARYKAQIAESPTASSFPLEEWREIYATFRKSGLRPFKLPWCVTCDSFKTGKSTGE